MGLDMYIYSSNPEAKVPLVYWRKANQIRQWFVDHTELEYDDDCCDITLTRDNLVNLVNDCQRVLDNPQLAESVMPTSYGFFFGPTDYDEDYYADLEQTIRDVNEVLKTIPEEDFTNEEIYYWEWW